MASFRIDNINDKINPIDYYECSDIKNPLFEIPYLKDVSSVESYSHYNNKFTFRKFTDIQKKLKPEHEILSFLQDPSMREY